MKERFVIKGLGGLQLEGSRKEPINVRIRCAVLEMRKEDLRPEELLRE